MAVVADHPVAAAVVVVVVDGDKSWEWGIENRESGIGNRFRLKQSNDPGTPQVQPLDYDLRCLPAASSAAR